MPPPQKKTVSKTQKKKNPFDTTIALYFPGNFKKTQIYEKGFQHSLFSQKLATKVLNTIIVNKHSDTNSVYNFFFSSQEKKKKCVNPDVCNLF